MKLKFYDNFKIEVELNGEDILIEGKFKRLTKKDEDDIKTKFKKDLALLEEMGTLGQKANKIQLQLEFDKDNKEIQSDALEIFDRVNKIKDEIEKSDSKEKMAKYRFNLSVESEQLKTLIEIASLYGYSEVINAINESVEEGKRKDTQN